MDVYNFSASDVAMTCVVGVLIVFSALAVIWLCLAIMERVFRKDKPAKKNDTLTVCSPFAGSVISVASAAEVSEKDFVLTLSCEDGSVADILSPVAGKVSLRVVASAKINKGDTLFTVEER